MYFVFYRASMEGVHIKQEPHMMMSEHGGLLGGSSLSHMIKHEMLEHGGGGGGGVAVNHLQHPMEDSGDEMDAHHDDYKDDEQPSQQQRPSASSLDVSDVDDDEDDDVAQDLSMAPDADAGQEHSNQG